MSTKALSKIKTARRPARGSSYPCEACIKPIRPGDEYFCHQTGQRTSHAFCLECMRSRSTPEPLPHGLLAARRLYAERYGIIDGGVAHGCAVSRETPAREGAAESTEGGTGPANEGQAGPIYLAGGWYEYGPGYNDVYFIVDTVHKERGPALESGRPAVFAARPGEPFIDWEQLDTDDEPAEPRPAQDGVTVICGSDSIFDDVDGA